MYSSSQLSKQMLLRCYLAFVVCDDIMILVLQVTFMKWRSSKLLPVFGKTAKIYCEHTGIPSHFIDVSVILAFPILNKQ